MGGKHGIVFPTYHMCDWLHKCAYYFLATKHGHQFDLVCGCPNGTGNQLSIRWKNHTLCTSPVCPVITSSPWVSQWLTPWCTLRMTCKKDKKLISSFLRSSPLLSTADPGRQTQRGQTIKAASRSHLELFYGAFLKCLGTPNHPSHGWPL